MESGEAGVAGGGEWLLQSPLHVAAYSGDKERLLEILENSDVDEADENGRTGLMYCAIADQLECLQLLLNRGAVIAAKDTSGQTALHWAAATGNYKSLKALLQLSQLSDLTVKDNDGRCPLHLATSHTNSKCLSAIVRKLKAIHLNEVDSEGMTALHWSAYNNTQENVRILLKAGADIVIMDVDGKTALHWTANNPDDNTVRTLLELAPTAVNLKDGEGRTALHLAVAAGNVPVIEALCSNTVGMKCDVNAVDMQFRTPLHWAAVLGLSEVVGILMERGANPNLTDAVGATCLHYAAQKNHVDCVSGLLTFPSVRDMADSDGRTALMWAAQRGNYNVLKAMLEREGDVHACDKLGATALHAAALSGHARCVQLLLQHSAKLNAVDSNGHTPLFRACERGHTEVVVVLSHAGASVDLRDANERTCLHWAASGGHAGICSSLLHHGLPVDSVDSGGRTALHCAAYGGFTECLNVLLSEGHADINLQDVEGITALHWACSAGHLDAVHQLVSAGASVNMMEVDFERLTPLDYAIIGGHQEVAQLLIENGALSISSIKELASVMIQKCVRGYLARRRVTPVILEMRAKRASQVDTTTTRSSSIVINQAVEVTDGGPVDPALTWKMKEEALAARRSALEEQVRESERQSRRLQSWSSSNLKGKASGFAAKERERVGMYRQKTKAALVIQLAWRRYIRRKRHRDALEAQARALHRGTDAWRRELAALIIQLAWRQYLRRKLLKRSTQRQKILHDWSPCVVAARQKILVQKVYGRELQTIHYEPPKPRQMVRPAYLNFIPSPAALSFNFALQSYHPTSQNKGTGTGHSLTATI